MVCLFCDVMIRFFIGENLVSVVERIDHAVDLSVDYNQKSVVKLIDPLKQACLNLMGRSEDPLVLTGDIMEEKHWKSSLPGMDTMMKRLFLMVKLYLAIYMNDIDYAGHLMEEYRKDDPGVIMPYIYKYLVLYKGIIAAASSQKTITHRWRPRKYLRYLERSMLRCPENHANKVFLLRAEITASAGHCDDAVLHFTKSIHYATKDGFLNEQAFACERAARMYLSRGHSSEAVLYFHEAIKLYDQWGAKVKVHQLKRIMAEEKLDLTGTS